MWSSGLGRYATKYMCIDSTSLLLSKWMGLMYHTIAITAFASRKTITCSTPDMYKRPLNYIYIYVWKLNQTVLELDFRAVKFLFFPHVNIFLTCIVKVQLITFENPHCCDFRQKNSNISVNVLPSCIYRRIILRFYLGFIYTTSVCRFIRFIIR
jgi:hypothetical protein